MQIKLLAIFAFILVLLVFLLVRIVYINLKDGKEYEKQVLSQENYDSRTLYSRRGEIQDRNGQLLAYSVKVYRLVIDCKEINNTTEVTKKDDAVNATIEVLSEQFDLDSAAIRDLIENENKDEIDNIVSIMVEVMSTKCEYFTISGKKYQADPVHQRYSQITCQTIEYVLECVHKCGSDILNIKQYLVASQK